MRVALPWSGGKDSSLALYMLKSSREHEIAYLLTTFTESYDRVTMYGERTSRN